MKHTYAIENLDCAHCAAKVEEKIQALPQVKAASLTFATKKLTVESDEKKGLTKLLIDTANTVESGVNFTELEENKVVRKKKKSIFSEHGKEIAQLILGALLFVIGMLVGEAYPVPRLVIFMVAYLILGLEIVIQAAKNIAKGQVFDENFLMSLATIAACVIGDYPEAVGVMLFYRVGEFFQDLAVERSRSQIMEAVDLRPEVVLLVEEGDVREIPSESAKVGQILKVRPGDRIPLDGVVVSGESRIDTSPITGEPVPRSVGVGDELISGCINKQGVLTMKVEKPLSESMVTRILNSVENAAAMKPKMDKFITRFAKVYTPIVVAIALLTAIVPSLVTGEWHHWVYTAITFLVISCPCALVLSVPLAFFSGIGAASKRGILLKGGLAIEGLDNVKAVVMDKTGTLTKGEFVVKEVKSYGKLSEKQILNVAANCEQSSTHPIAGSILVAASERHLQLVSPNRLEEISGKGVAAEFNEGTVLAGNAELLELYQVAVPAEVAELAGTVVLVAIAGRLEGAIVIDDTLKEDAKEAVAELHGQGLYTAMLTGDGESAAQAMGNRVGVKRIFSKLLPQDKLQRLGELRSEIGPVLFVGDGINDAPVLAGADVGAAMGAGADAAIEAADVVFMNNTVTAIPKAIRIAKATGMIAKQNVAIALLVKAIIMILGFLGFANMWLAVFADTGVALICVLNSVRILYKKF